MKKRVFHTGCWQTGCWQVAGLWVAVFAVMVCAAAGLRAQSGGAPVEEPLRTGAQTSAPTQRPPARATQPVAFRIPIEPLGFTAPGAFYLGLRQSMASLDFIDENRLLFTFRVPGLIRRQESEIDKEDVRQIRAVVLALPSGNVLSEAVWSVHGRARYLWMLKDGHFLVRDGGALLEGDATLELKPKLRFPGPITWLEIDPTEQYIVTDSLEPETDAGSKELPNPPRRAGDQGPVETAPSSAAADMTVEGVPDDGKKQIVVRVLRRDTGKVMLVSRTRASVHLPINGDGYLEALRGNNGQWHLILDYFSGGSTTLGRVESTCIPGLEFASQRELLATTCDRNGGRRLVAIASDGLHLWQGEKAQTPVWPLLVRSADGLRLARESLMVAHPVSATSPLDNDDIKGQLVEVFDAATGKILLTTTASPVLDAGGNVAISLSGRRVAVVSDRAIQVYELPAPPPLPPESQVREGFPAPPAPARVN